ncbi:MAG: response regulator [Rhodocyclaceae bacterium]|jgi:diguanylate cyclase (GGDEF)-like protein|nr:response regulator [Rhodocyclaceae bacterium]
MSEQDTPPGTKILIVDDSRMVRASIIKHIRGRFEFREEADGEAGWQALVVDPSIELVLTDISMPKLDGYGLLERIRESKLSRLQHLPVVVISGDEDDAARERARALGADDFITKGISATELLARLDSLSRLARTRRELEESRAALARQQHTDTVTGFMSESMLNWHGGQDLPNAGEMPGGISAMVIEIDSFLNIAERHGQKVSELVARKLSRILTAKVRQEDTVAQLGPGQFAVLSPHSDTLSCCAFALRLQKAIRKLVMTYREERIRISVTAGVASSAADGMTSVSHLVGIAVKRVEEGKRRGGSCVVSEHGQVDDEWVENKLKQMVSIDQMLARLRMGDTTETRERLSDVIATLLPLLELIESELHCGMPIDALAVYRSDERAAQ